MHTQDENIHKQKKQPRFSIRKGLSKLNFLPKTRDFFIYFEQMGGNLVTGAELLQKIVHNDPQKAHLLEELVEQEHQADRSVREAVELLHKTFLTPVDREDIHTLIMRLDDVIDLICAIGKRYTLYGIDENPNEMGELAEVIVKSVGQVLMAVTALRKLKDPKNIIDACIAVSRLENVADDLLDKSLAKLFHDNWTPFQVIQFKELLESLETVTDLCKIVTQVVQEVVLKHA
ncbi:MAG: DUF47 family protein [Chlamydiota bacterium]|nr:DUF47 family protein [Chlamydiota bacterium]